MWLFDFIKKLTNRNSQIKQASGKLQLRILILEPILTPSGILPDSGDGFIDIPTPDAIPDSHLLDCHPIEHCLENPIDPSVSNSEIEYIPFIDSDPTLGNQSAQASSIFNSGVFTVGETGKVSIDFLFDGGRYQGELAIFSLEGMEQYNPGSAEFIHVAAERALSNSTHGHVVISDLWDGAKLPGIPGEDNYNTGLYQGGKTFDMVAGDRFGLMLIPNGTVQQVWDSPAVSSELQPLFSMATANPNDAFHLGQIADVTGNKNIFVMEDLRVDGWTDRDYNDIIFQIKGATGEAVHLDTVINPEYNWIGSDLWHQILESDRPEPLPTLDYEPGKLLIKFDADVTDAEIAAIATNYGAIDIDSFHPVNPNIASPLAQWRIVELAPNVDTQQALSIFANDSHVEAAELDRDIFLLAQPNDTQFNQQWGLHNTGQTGGTALADIHAPEAWDIQTGDRSIKVAVIDSGIDYNHQDLAANIWRNTGEIANNGIDDDGNGYIDDVQGYDFINKDSDPMDDWDTDPLNQEFLGHGTHTAGIIGAVGNNNIGISGVAQQVSLMPLKFANGETGKLSTATDAIIYAINNGARVINASWGSDTYSLLLEDAIKSANNANILFVAAAGNFSSDNDQQFYYPANSNLPNVITVASTTQEDRLSSFSNYGQFTVDIAAPGGEDVTDTNPEDILSTTPNNTYSYKNGTSMATPYVAGAAALLLAENPNLTPQQLRTILMSTADQLPDLQGNTVSGGRLNLENAVKAAGDVQLEWVQQIGTSQFDEARGITTDSNGNLYLTGITQGNLSGTSQGGQTNQDAWIMKLDSDGNEKWRKQFGTTVDDNAEGVAADNFGNVYAVGAIANGTTNNNFEDSYFIKFDSDGNAVWIKQLLQILKSSFGYTPIHAMDVTTDSLGNVYVAGQLRIAGEFWTAKFDSNGNLVWAETLPFARGTTNNSSTANMTFDLAVDASGSVYLTGWTNGSVNGEINAGGFDAWVAKYDSNGSLIRTQEFGTSASDRATSITIDSKGNVYLTGRTQGDLGGTNAGGWDIWLSKYDSQGNSLWSEQLGTAGDEVSWNVSIDRQDKVYVTGYTTGSLDGNNAGDLDILLAKYTSEGQLQWTKQLGSSALDAAWGVAVDDLGRIYVTGQTQGDLAGSQLGNGDAWVARYSFD